MFKSWLDKDGPVRFVIDLPLKSLDGPKTPVFPPTYLKGKGKDATSAYNINRSHDGNICDIDSPGSQSNRMSEMLLKGEQYGDLVPHGYLCNASGGNKLDLIKLGHRIADAILKASNQYSQIRLALEAHKTGNHVPIAQILPTSYTFGFWDSRDSGIKWPRVVHSTIRAYKVTEQVRAAGFSVTGTERDYYSREVLTAAKLDKDNLGKDKKACSKAGLIDVPPLVALGGVIVEGEILRQTSINISSIRKLSKDVQEYILALSLVAATGVREYNLRQGCHLTPAVPTEKPLGLLHGIDGEVVEQPLDRDEIKKFAESAAASFGVSSEDTMYTISKANADKLIDDARKKAAKEDKKKDDDDA